MIKIPRLQDFPGLTKPDVEKAYITRCYLITSREDIPVLIATYAPRNENDTGEPCPLCDVGSYYHISAFSPKYRDRVGRTICTECFDGVEMKLKGLSSAEIKSIEEYSRRKFGDEIFDEWMEAS